LRLGRVAFCWREPGAETSLGKAGEFAVSSTIDLARAK
jgi:hypothetical protein